MSGGAHPETIEQTLARIRGQSARSGQPETIEQTLAGIRASSAPPDDDWGGEGAGGYGERLASHALNVVSGFQPTRALAAAAGAVGSKFTDHPMSYRESLGNLNEMTDRIPETTRKVERVAGALGAGLRYMSGGRSTLGAAGGGAAFGVAQGLGNADPDVSAKDRMTDAAIQGGIGAATPLVIGSLAAGVRGLPGTRLGVAARAKMAPKLDDVILGQRANAKAASDAAFGTARSEAAAAGGTSPEIQAALGDSRFSEQATRTRAAPKHATASDAEVLMRVRQKLSKKQGGLLEQQQRQGWDEARDEAIDVLRGQKGEVVDALKPIAPSLPGAIAQHAEGKATQRGTAEMVRATQRAAKDTPTPLTKMDRESPAVILDAIRKMSQERAAGGREAVLAALKPSVRAKLSPDLGRGFGLTTLFGALPALSSAGRVAPFVRGLDQVAGDVPFSTFKPSGDLLTKLGLSAYAGRR